MVSLSAEARTGGVTEMSAFSIEWAKILAITVIVSLIIWLWLRKFQPISIEKAEITILLSRYRP